MFQMVTTIIKWASIPVLLIASLFSYVAGNYAPLVDCMVWMGAVFFLQRAVWEKRYFWGAGLGMIVVAFSPLFLVTKIFLLIALACIAASLTLLATFRPQPVAAL